MSSFDTLSSETLKVSGSAWSIERVVAVLTPVFSALSGVLSTFLAKLVPGLTLSPGSLTAIFIAGATLAGAVALKWLHGRQKWLQPLGDAGSLVDAVTTELKAHGAGLALADIENTLKAHEGVIVKAIGDSVHLPASAEQVAEQVVQKLLFQQRTAPAGGGAVAGPIS